MTKSNEQNHTILTEMDGSKERHRQCNVAETDILLDVKFLMNEYYIATCTSVKNARLAFNNGYKFEISVKKTSLGKKNRLTKLSAYSLQMTIILIIRKYIKTAQ